MMANTLRIPFRVLVVAAVLSVILGLAPGRGFAGSSPAQGQQVDLLGLHQRWLNALNRGDVEGALALFTSDAIYQGGYTCQRLSCRGKDGIRSELQTLVDDHWAASKIDIQQSSTTWDTWTIGRFELRSDAVSAAGQERVLGVSTVVARGEQIASVQMRFDHIDPQSAAFIKSRPAPAPFPAPPLLPDNRMVDIGGRRLFLECAGSGSPTVFLDGSGAGFSAANAGTVGLWVGNADVPQIHVLQDLAQVTRVCAYDRAGYGRSDQSPILPHTAGSSADDLHALIHASGEPGPYVLAGYALGGPIVQLYASRYPEDVAGLVLLNYGPSAGFLEGLPQFLPSDLATQFQSLVQQTYTSLAGPKGPGGGFDFSATLAEEQAAGQLPDVPLVDLVAGLPPNPATFPAGWTDEQVAQANQLSFDLEADLVQGLPQAQFVIVDNFEDAVNFSIPQRVTDAIVQVIDTVRDQAAAAAGLLP
jgi:pimeloyl-ACP methyl ester carboxylesterase